MTNKTDVLLDRIKATGVPILKIYNETGIPSSRMYKWFGGKDGKSEIKGSPKYKDVGILTKWVVAHEQRKPFNLLEEEEIEYGPVVLKEKVLSHDALLSVLAMEVAALISGRTGEPVQSVVRRLYKAAEDASDGL